MSAAATVPVGQVIRLADASDLEPLSDGALDDAFTAGYRAGLRKGHREGWIAALTGAGGIDDGEALRRWQETAEQGIRACQE